MFELRAVWCWGSWEELEQAHWLACGMSRVSKETVPLQTPLQNASLRSVVLCDKLRYIKIVKSLFEQALFQVGNCKPEAVR